MERRGTVGSRQTNAVRETAVGTAAAGGKEEEEEEWNLGTAAVQRKSRDDGQDDEEDEGDGCGSSDCGGRRRVLGISSWRATKESTHILDPLRI